MSARRAGPLALVALLHALVAGCGSAHLAEAEAEEVDAGAAPAIPGAPGAKDAAPSAARVADGAPPEDRMPPIAPERYTAAQKKAVDAFVAARKVPVFGPFVPLMRSPEVMTQARGMGDYLRYRSAIGTTLSELVTLIVAREWSQDYVWYVHQPIAAKSGIKPEIIEAIRTGSRPVGMSEDEETIYDLSTELTRTKRVSDRTYGRAVKRFGEIGVIDLVSLNGYYTFLAMTMNTTRMALPGDAKRLPRFPE